MLKCIWTNASVDTILTFDFVKKGRTLCVWQSRCIVEYRFGVW
jgi:hypothetical protein